MGIFATLRPNAATRNQHCELSDHLERVRSGLPPRFEALAELLSAGADTEVACSVIGREMARTGVDLGEALRRLETTYRLMVGTEPTFKDVQALSVSWGEETLGYLHQLSCVDPLTGLASLAHMRARLSEVYQRAEQRGASTSDQFALVLVDLPLSRSGAEDRLSSGLRLAKAADNLGIAFAGGQTIARVNATRLVALVERGPMLGRRVQLVRELFEDLGELGSGTRVWIEGLPTSNQGAAWLLDELARQ